MNAHPAYDQFGQRQRELPCNIEAEQCLLGAMLVNSEAFHAVSDRVEVKHFHEPLHGLIFETIGNLVRQGKGANPVTLKPYLPNEMVGDLTMSQYLARLATEAVTIVNAPNYADAVRFDALRRDLIGSGQNLEDVGFDVGSEIALIEEIEAVQARLAEIVRGLQGNETNGSSFAEASALALDRTAKAYSKQEIAGVDCGITIIKRLIGVMTPGQLIIIGGGTKQGKSALAGQIARGAAINGVPVYVYSGEMDKTELAMREIARDTGIGVSRQKQGDVSESEYSQMMTAQRSLANLPWLIQDRRRNLDQLEREAEAYVKRHGPSLFIIDSVTLVERDQNTRRMSNWEFAETVTDRLKSMARKLECPVIALSQLKKNTFVVDKPWGKKVDASVYRNVVNRRPRFSDILGACERDADHVIIPFRAEPILDEIEPAEASEEHFIWEEVKDANRGRAEIILALSRERQWPRKIGATWEGVTTSFGMPGDDQRGLF